MKPIILTTIVSIHFFIVKAQNLFPVKETNSITITTLKTTNLVFATPVLHVDRGTPDVLVAPVKEAGNILLVKAAKAGFRPTNISVVTKEGGLYNIAVGYDSNPKQFVYRFTSAMADAGENTANQNQSPGLSLSQLKGYANAIQHYKRGVRGIKGKGNGMVVIFNGIYHKGNTFFFQIAIKNHTTHDYGWEGIRMFVTDKKQLKRTATQQREVMLLHATEDKGEVPAGGQKVIVWTANKVIPAAKEILTIEITPKEGTRTLLLKVPRHRILQSVPLTD